MSWHLTVAGCDDATTVEVPAGVNIEQLQRICDLVTSASDYSCQPRMSLSEISEPGPIVINDPERGLAPTDAVELRVTRDVPADEHHNCLGRNVKAGEVLYLCTSPTYGVIAPGGIAVTEQPDEPPFAEFPRDAVSMPECEPHEHMWSSVTDECSECGKTRTGNE